MDAMTASFIKLLIFLPFVLILAYISLKLGNNYMMKLGSGRIIKVIEKVPVSTKTYLCVAVINEKPYVISSSDTKVEILMDLPLDVLEKQKQVDVEGKLLNSSFMENFIKNLASNFKLLLNRKDRL